MNQNTGRSLAVAIFLIILGLIMYGLFFRGGPTPNHQKPETAPGPAAPGPEPAKPPQVAPAQPEITPPKQPGEPPTPSESGLPKGGPAPELTPTPPKATVFPPEKEKEQYTFLVNRYRRHRDANKMREKLKDRGIPSFIRQSPKDPGLTELWAGPFATPDEARAAEKSLRDLLRGPRQIYPMKGTIPK